MQTVQCFATGNRSNLQRLRDNLQDLPKRWLQPRSDSQEDVFLGNVQGECNYRFTFRLEGGGFFQTGVLVASAETFQGGLPVPLRCKWKRKVGDLPVDIPGVTSNMYQISADDVGTDICVEAQPADQDDGLHGVVTGEIGPFELDPATRRSLDNALGLGAARFHTMQSKAPGDPAAAGTSRLDLVIHVTAEGVGVAPVQPDGTTKASREVVAEYSADYPKVIVHPLDTSKFQIVMSESRVFHLMATSRTSRDLIALTIRCFHAQKFLPTSEILQALLPVRDPLVQGAPASQAGAPADSKLDASILLERLAKELNRTMQQKEVSERVHRNTNHETKDLQAQLMETISGFTEVITGLQEQFEDGTSTPATASVLVERLQEQLRDTAAQNREAGAELESLRWQLGRLQAARLEAEKSSGSPQLSPEEEAAQLRQERDLLQARLGELRSTGSVLQRDNADQAHTQELKRLRQDVEALHNTKEQLREQLQLQDRERQELQDNFLYVKNQLDKVQLKQADAAEDLAEGCPRELAKHHAAVRRAGEERAQLGVRAEALLREMEREKAYHEQSLERVVQANARLMEERDRAAQEVDRLGRLYAETARQLREVAELDTTAAADAGALADFGGAEGGAPPVSEEQLCALRAKVAETEQIIERKDKENESLKNRIRKLAVA